LFNLFFLFLYYRHITDKPIDHVKMKKIHELEDRMNLSFDQHEEIGRIKRKHERFVMNQMDEINYLKNRINMEIFNETPDSSYVAESINEIGDLQERIIDESFTHHSQIKGLLNPDQIMIFKQIVEERSKMPRETVRPERPGRKKM